MSSDLFYTELKNQLSLYFIIDKIRIATVDLFYVSDFTANDFSICNPTKYF